MRTLQNDRIVNDYYNWLCYLVDYDRRFKEPISYSKLLTLMHTMEFTYIIPKDQNRIQDGIDMRYRFAMSQMYHQPREFIFNCLAGPCSILEMMVALAVRCEENIMDDPNIGNRTGQWFWGMVVNLGLGYMSDDNFDNETATDILTKFVNRQYSPNGCGGLFKIRHCKHDLRDVEIWYQMCWYLDEIT